MDMWASPVMAQGCYRHLVVWLAHAEEAGPHLVLLWHQKVCNTLGQLRILLHPSPIVYLHP